MANFDIAVAKTLLKEGGGKITNDPTDNGGLTKYGITKRSYPNLDISNLTEQQAKDIYYKDFWVPIFGDEINLQTMAESIFDFAVNANVKTSVICAQASLHGPFCDGKMGAQTLASLNSTVSWIFFRSFALEKVKHYAAICDDHPDQIKWLHGWINRSLEGL